MVNGKGFAEKMEAYSAYHIGMIPGSYVPPTCSHSHRFTYGHLVGAPWCHLGLGNKTTCSSFRKDLGLG